MIDSCLLSLLTFFVFFLQFVEETGYLLGDFPIVWILLILVCCAGSSLLHMGSLVAAGRPLSRWAARAAHCRASCRGQARGPRLIASLHVRSSWTRGQISVPWAAGCVLNHGPAREVLPLAIQKPYDRREKAL